TDLQDKPRLKYHFLSHLGPSGSSMACSSLPSPRPPRLCAKLRSTPRQLQAHTRTTPSAYTRKPPQPKTPRSTPPSTPTAPPPPPPKTPPPPPRPHPETPPPPPATKAATNNPNIPISL